VAGLARAARRRVNVPVAVVAVAISLLTFVFGWVETVHHPQTAYFSTFTRGWELGVGAVLACLLPVMKQIPRWLAVTAGWLGVALIFAGFLWTPTSHGFPVPWAALAVGGSALVLASGGLGVPSRNWLLTNRVSVFLGDISYSIYLTHFPLVIILGALMTTSKADYYTAVLVGTLGLSMASYYLVEEPVRTLSFSRHLHLERRVLAAVTCCAVAVGAYAIRPPVPVPSFAKQINNEVVMTAKGVDAVAPLPGLKAELKQSLQLRSWPTLTNQATVDKGRNSDTCEKPRTLQCSYGPADGSATKTVVLVGDSVMVTWLSMMKAVFLPHHWRVVQLAVSDCFGADVPYADRFQGNGGALTQNAKCDRQHAYVRSVLASLHPNLVLIDNMSDAIYKVSDGRGHLLPHSEQRRQYEAGLTRTIEMAKKAGAHPVLLSATPNHREWSTCQVAGSTPLNCVRPPEKRWREIQKSDIAVAKRSRAVYLDTLPLWCVAGECPNVVGTLATIVGSHHITQEYGVRVAPSLEAALKKLHLI
ncbi:MAG: acyltransferase family protein, partial [Marmoricola sp.]